MPKTLKVKSTDFLFSQVLAEKDGCSLGAPEEVSRTECQMWRSEQNIRLPRTVSMLRDKGEDRREENPRHAQPFWLVQPQRGSMSSWVSWDPGHWLSLSWISSSRTRGLSWALMVLSLGQAGRPHDRSNTPTSMPVLPLGSPSGS